MNKRQTNKFCNIMKQFVAVLDYANEVHAFCTSDVDESLAAESEETKRKMETNEYVYDVREPFLEQYLDGKKINTKNAPEYDDLLHQIAVTILREGKARCPVDTESLRDTARIIKRGFTGYDVVFGCGINKETGEHIDYATYVHEIGRYHHIIGQAKYLEDAVIEVQNNLKGAGAELRIGIEYDVLYGNNTGCMVAHVGGTAGRDMNLLEEEKAKLFMSKSFRNATTEEREIMMRGSTIVNSKKKGNNK